MTSQRKTAGNTISLHARICRAFVFPNGLNFLLFLPIIPVTVFFVSLQYQADNDT